MAARLVDALAEVNIDHPFPIQQMSIPIALTGTDIIGQARTGTGKTLGVRHHGSAADHRPQ